MFGESVPEALRAAGMAEDHHRRRTAVSMVPVSFRAATIE